MRPRDPSERRRLVGRRHPGDREGARRRHQAEAPQLVLCGRQAIDDDMGAVTAQLAELLGWPCASWIMEEAVDAEGKTVRAARQVEGGLEVFALPLPAVLAAQKGLNEPRYPTLKGIM